MTESQIIHLCKALRKHPLTDKNLQACNVVGVTALRKLVKKKTLRSINLNGNELGSEQVTKLAKALASNQNALTTIKLSNNRIQSSAALKALSDLFISLPNLKTIELADNVFTDGAFASLIEVLPSLFALTSLNIDNNNLRKKGIKALTNVMASTPLLAI